MTSTTPLVLSEPIGLRSPVWITAWPVAETEAKKPMAAAKIPATNRQTVGRTRIDLRAETLFFRARHDCTEPTERLFGFPRITGQMIADAVRSKPISTPTMH